jgi:uncharacterized repeat protein (TIGR01451 family)
MNTVLCYGDTIVWTTLVADLDSTIGSTAVFSNFRDAINNENPLTETSAVIDEVGTYFFRKTTDAGCYDIETIIFIPEDCGNTCLAEPGTYDIGEVTCFDGELATISVAQVNQATIPTGYQEFFILSVGDEKEILTAELTPEFIVEASGQYRVHSSVFDPTDMRLEEVPDDLNTIDEFISYFMNEGSDICISIDPEGVLIDVEMCTDVCGAFAGSPIAGDIECLDDQPIELLIEMNPLDILIPDGYEQIFVLTQGPELIIMGAQNDLFFVDAPGEYRVHSLVFDPLTLDLGIVEPGGTSAFDIFNLLIEGGGEICASLDLNGAFFNVTECVDDCTADAGTTIAAADFCVGDSSVTLLAGISNAIIPEGYDQYLVMTTGEGQVVQTIQEGPIVVDSTGQYRIHSFVYNSETLDLSSVILGETTLTSILTLISDQSTCASIDQTGVEFEVEICADIEIVDLELTKDISNENPAIGEEVTFTISLTNNSENIASGVAVADRLPSGYSLSGNISDGGISEQDENSTEILWAGVTVLPMTTERFTFTAVINESEATNAYKNIAEVVACDQEDLDSTPNNDDGDQSEDDEDNVMPSVQIATVDLELVKTASLSSVQPGQQVVYNINLANRSMVEATGIMVEDILPQELDITSISNISNYGQINRNRIVWTGLEMSFLSSMNLSYTILVNSDAAEGTLTNVAQIIAADQPDVDSTPDNDDGDQSEDDEDREEISVIASFIDLSLCKEVNNPTPIPGEIVTFEITVNNNGIIPATGVSVTDVLPLSGYDLSSISNVQPIAQSSENVLVWTIDEILPNDEVTMSFDVIVTPNGYDYKNIAEVSSANEQDGDSTPGNDDGDQSEDDEHSAMVTPVVDVKIIDLEVDKEVSELSPAIGELITYEVLIVNNGPFDATNIVLQDVTPDGIDAMDVTGNHTLENGIITWNIPSLPAGEIMVFEYSSIVFESLTDNYTNILEVMSADQEDVDSTPGNDDGDQSEDDEASATIFPIIQTDIIDLELTKGVDNPCAGSYDRVTFSIEIFNNSEFIATGIGVEDILSDGFIQIEDISHGGTLDGSKISWSGLSLLPEEILVISYSALVCTSGNSYENIAQITAADQSDSDSTPNNDDGDQSEDDEDSVVLKGSSLFDLELEKNVDNIFAQPGDRVRFDITVNNVGCINATNVAIRDIIPSGYKSIRNITDFGV